MTIAITILVWIGFVCLIFRTKGEEGDVLQRVSTRLYKELCINKLFGSNMKTRDRQLMQNLAALHPGEASARLLVEYYTGKIRIVLIILLAGSGLACSAEIAGGASDVVVYQGVVNRGNATQTVKLEAEVEAEGEIIKEEITLDIKERELTKAEAEAFYEEFVAALNQLILGNNPSLQEVREDLRLPYEVEGYPFTISWTSDNNTLLEREGIVHIEDLEEDVNVRLKAEIAYGEFEWEHSWNVTLQPPVRTGRERLLYDLKKQSNAAAEENRYEESFQLPQTIDGKTVSWKQSKESSGILILFFAFAAAVIVYYMKDKDLQDELIQRRIQMKLEYPVMVCKYALFLGAGMTIRGAFQKICRDHYEKEQKAKHPLYEEMLYSCNELRAGVSESKVYEKFGKRTGVQEYTRLCALLSQNLKKGNTALIQRMKEECDEASRESLHLKKRQGEEAGTKLLAPMVMMLLMVLVMIMLPAFSGLGT